jgi:hypothetical protein
MDKRLSDRKLLEKEPRHLVSSRWIPGVECSGFRRNDFLVSHPFSIVL